MAETILQEAQRLTAGERQRDYGHPHHDYSRVVAAFSALTGHDLTPAQGAIFMCCVKLARECTRPKRDNRVDLAGYAHVLDMIQQKEDAQ